MLQGGCPSRTAPFFTLHIPAGGNFYGCFHRLSFSIGRCHIEKRGATITAAPLQKRFRNTLSVRQS